MLFILQVATGVFVGGVLALVVREFFAGEATTNDVMAGCVLALVILAVLGGAVWWFSQ